MIIEQFDLPKDMVRGLNEMSERRAWPLVQEAFNFNRPLKRAVRDVYIQGLADGYECRVGRHASKGE